MKPSENPLGSEPVSTLLRRFAVPSVIAMLVSALYNMVDQLFIGHSIGVLGNASYQRSVSRSVWSAHPSVCSAASAVLQTSISAWADESRSTRNLMLEVPSPCWQSSV